MTKYLLDAATTKVKSLNRSRQKRLTRNAKWEKCLSPGKVYQVMSIYIMGLQLSLLTVIVHSFIRF
jgi:hypothetical protein